MLSQSGINLKKNTIEFIQSHESISILCPYIKVDAIKQILESSTVNQIVIRWQIQDLVQGSSDLELFDYCQENNITLYRNTRIHLKAFWNNENSVLFGSANISARGIGEEGNYNYELNGICTDMSFEDKLYLQNIIAESELVDQTLFDKIKKLVEECPKPTLEFPQLDTLKKVTDYFLLSQLPMSDTPSKLFEVYSDPSSSDKFDQRCALYDLALYNIPLSLDEDEFFKLLKRVFNQHPFIQKLKGHIKTQSRQSLNYGGVIRWIQDHTTTVPTPRSWELKEDQIVNILYDWICYFDEQYSWERPSYSQVIRYVS